MIADRVAAVRERIARAAARAGRKAGDVTLVAVSKTFPAEGVRQAFTAGVRDFAENKVQEAEAKAPALADLLPRGLRWHLVGHLQKNKSKKAVALFDVIQSLDEVDLAHHLEQYAAQQKKVIQAFVQVDLAGEETKFGFPEKLLFPALESLRGFKSVRVRGLMVLPPFSADPEGARPYFRRLRALSDRAVAESLLLGPELSMGMSHDFEVAIEEGATHVRVGTAIFGERVKKE